MNDPIAPATRTFWHNKPLHLVAGEAVSCCFLSDGSRVTTHKATGIVRIDRVRK